jgi:MYXO-CTERM domain-containing protein
MLVALATALPALANPSVLFHIHDPQIDEASGIARGVASPGVFYVQNDSGDSARFFAVDASTGRTRAVYTVPNATNHDWEDLAVARDAAGTPSVWLADIGDNDAARSEVRLYRVAEPRVDMSRFDVTARTHLPDVWRLRYPSGPANAESLAVAPGGRAYVITKADSGRSVVYRVPLRPDARHVQLLQRVGSITLASRGGLVPASLQVLATGAAFSPDGTLLVVRTYTDAYAWHVRHGDVAAAIRHRPVRVTIPLQPQGEGVCIEAGALVLDSEGDGTAVYRAPLPAALQPRPSGTPASAPSSAPPAQPTTQPTQSASPDGSADATPYIVLFVVVAVLGVGFAVLWRRRRE